MDEFIQVTIYHIHMHVKSEGMAKSPLASCPESFPAGPCCQSVVSSLLQSSGISGTVNNGLEDVKLKSGEVA